jgi:DNA polymerase
MKEKRPPPPVPGTGGLKALKPAADTCRACPIGDRATQAVVGEGPRHAGAMLVGEQPGNDEDLAGRPFVGPSGRLLGRALEAAGVERAEVYVTNAVKHFKWTTGRYPKKRLHQRPSAGEVKACRPWLEREIGLVRPRVIVCLGATAALAVFGRAVSIRSLAGRVHEDLALAPAVVVTYHPSSALRAITPEQRRFFERAITEALRLAKRQLGRPAGRKAA